MKSLLSPPTFSLLVALRHREAIRKLQRAAEHLEPPRGVLTITKLTGPRVRVAPRVPQLVQLK